MDWVAMFKPFPDKNKYAEFYEYKEIKRFVKIINFSLKLIKYLLPTMLLGILFLFITIIIKNLAK